MTGTKESNPKGRHNWELQTMHGLFSETVKGVENNANMNMGMGLSQAQAETAVGQDTGREHSLVGSMPSRKDTLV